MPSTVPLPARLRSLAALVLTCLSVGVCTASAHSAPHRGGRTHTHGHAVAEGRHGHAAAKRRHKPTPKLAPKPPGQPVVAVQTNSSDSQELAVQPLEYFTAPYGTAPVIHVDDTQRYQPLTGYGAAMTDSSDWLLYGNLIPAVRAQVMQALFGASGLGFNLVRLPMGGSDFTVGETGYSYDDLPAGQTDPTLAHFSIAHDLSYIIPTLRMAMADNPSLQIMANPWSPPAWMKTNNAFGGWENAQLAPGMEGPLAQYFVEFLQAYAQAGVPIVNVSPENEPTSGAAFPAMHMPPDQEGDFITNYLVPALQAGGMHPNIWGADGADMPYVQALMQTSAASQIAGIAWHCYSGHMSALSPFHAQYPNVTQIVSECATGIDPYSVSEMFIDSTRNWASELVMWAPALDPQGGPVQPPNSGCGGCRPLVQIDPATKTARFTHDYYETGQVTRFVHPGAVRIYSDRLVSDFGADDSPWGQYGVTPGVDNVAFQNPDGSHVLVAHNNAVTAQSFAVSYHAKQFAYTLGAGATVTFIWGR